MLSYFYQVKEVLSKSGEYMFGLTRGLSESANYYLNKKSERSS
jgi:hypothetical protein